MRAFGVPVGDRVGVRRGGDPTDPYGPLWTRTDPYGHPMGDTCLVVFCTCIMKLSYFMPSLDHSAQVKCPMSCICCTCTPDLHDSWNIKGGFCYA